MKSFIAILLAGMGTFALVLSFFSTNVVVAGGVVLKNGVAIEGTPIPVSGLTRSIIMQSRSDWKSYPILMIDSKIKRYFVHHYYRGMQIDKNIDLGSYESFKIPQTKGSSKRGPTKLGNFAEVTKFDEHGRRRVTVLSGQKPVHIVQGITHISSKYLTLEGLTHFWETGMATTSLPVAELDPILRTATDASNPEDRLSIARFYLESGRFPFAIRELDSIKAEFPEMEDRVTEMIDSLRQLQANELLKELRRRQNAGQYELAYTACRQFPRMGLKAEILREIDSTIQTYRDNKEKMELVNLLLGDLQSELKNEKHKSAIEPVRREIRLHLGHASLTRLQAFLTLCEDETLAAEEKLALALSGWLLGSENAITNLDIVLNLIQARGLVLDYLRTDHPLDEHKILTTLEELEGVNPLSIEQLIQRLPMQLETPDIKAGEAFRIEAPKTSDNRSVAYWVLLPLEYTPQRSYPTILALHPQEFDARKETVWWGGTKENPLQAQRRGYIVIAPEYLNEGARAYDYLPESHEVILACIRDAQRRFHIDSDRLFLSGHGIGGDAAFDMGMSHPDLFAGVIPITGLCQYYSDWYWPNAINLPWYVVGGELDDRSALDVNSRELNRMLKDPRFDMMYVEYMGRGHETYYEEIHHLFDWMDLYKRKKHPKEFEMEMLRPSDNRFYWVEVHGLPRATLMSDVFGRQKSKPVRPYPLSVLINDGNEERTMVYIKQSFSKVVLHFSPELISFEKRLIVKVNNRQKFNDIPQRSYKTLLDDLRLRGDREKLFWFKLEL